jgi:hypothetical protein
MKKHMISVCLFALFTLTVRAQDGIAVTGTVVDAQGKPVAGVEVSKLLEPAKLTFFVFDGVVVILPK